MAIEGQLFDKKSLRAVTGHTANWAELAKDCVAFATASGGVIWIGVEDNQELPPRTQKIPANLPDTIRKRIGECTVNVTVLPELDVASNGGEFIRLNIPRSASGMPSTSKGQYFFRIADESKPVLGDEVLRLASERANFPWETLTAGGVSQARIDTEKWQKLKQGLLASNRVNKSVKEKTDVELWSHYNLAADGFLTNLGILFVGRQTDRAKLGTAPVIQFIKYDERGEKVNKLVWDDFSLNPVEMVEAVWCQVPDWQESYEIPDGLYRQTVPHYDEVVIRELLINALVHRPYTQRGDIFISLYPDRLQIKNPGRLPLGVTPKNILHESIRRNEHFAKLLHDLSLMEREGSGYDKIYEVLLSQGKKLPEVLEGPDSVEVVVRRRIFDVRIIDFVVKVDAAFELTQREKIGLGLLAQQEALTALELCRLLELKNAEALHPWIDRLVKAGIVASHGRTKGQSYLIKPEMVRKLNFKEPTTLKAIEPHRLKELILADLRKYELAGIAQIHSRIGSDIPRRDVGRMLKKLIEEGMVIQEGVKKHTRYRLHVGTL
ncbi:MAG: ATP-dependent DNA helicase [Veillonellaceae bacterium]|nr:ATP-dependent DNA helicase [Veillonellaceae bacterium]